MQSLHWPVGGSQALGQLTSMLSGHVMAESEQIMSMHKSSASCPEQSGLQTGHSPVDESQTGMQPAIKPSEHALSVSGHTIPSHGSGGSASWPAQSGAQEVHWPVAESHVLEQAA